MGISGLLPLLKDIQNTKHLSDFRGQTLAVDGYVWLHRGTYGCAAEVATGKRTAKYVEYAMHRVRLLRHHGIEPYLVFDGGPLPAKQGTESGRKQRREENLARANALAAQGKHSQAREYYVKCVDVTPQMAYQLIKALRAENVPYVVAPYEADAQLAYLERIGRVDGIITEDSDLLVFGCKNVLFKLDTTAATVACISRADFAAVVSSSSSSGGGLSLAGWSDAQFRAMTILSGCDYLPSIPGIGLKTAWALLRKHKTVENMLSALRLEGKKKVPAGYLDAFRLAEKVFLHQRVYDAARGELVHLTPLPDDEVDAWDAQKEAYVGAYIEPSLAKRIAEGDACPISLLPMEDINPAYIPRALRGIPMKVHGSATSLATPVARPDKGKGKAKVLQTSSEKPTKSKVGLLKFFSPQVQVQGREAAVRSLSPGPVRPVGASAGSLTGTGASPAAMVVGRKSGKRTLAEVMGDEMAAKRKRREREQFQEAASVGSASAAATVTAIEMDIQRVSTTSKFFDTAPRSVSDPRGDRRSRGVAPGAPHTHAHSRVQQQSVAGPSGLSRRGRGEETGAAQEKENIPCDPPEADADMDMGLAKDPDTVVAMGAPEAVSQEDGYMSPTESMGQWDSPDISSPVRSGAGPSRRHGGDGWDDSGDENDGDGEREFDADVLSSSPIAHARKRRQPPAAAERVVTRALPLRPVLNTSFSQRQRRSRRKSLGDEYECDRENGTDRSLNDAFGGAARGPDLRHAFDDCDWDEITSGGEDWEDSSCERTLEGEDVISSTASSTPVPVTPATDDSGAGKESSMVLLEEGSSGELEEGGAASQRTNTSGTDTDVGYVSARNSAVVAHGWWEKWARSGSGPSPGATQASTDSDRRRAPDIARDRSVEGLQRRETTMTPDGRQRPSRPPRQGPYSAPQGSKRKGFQQVEDLRVARRRSLAFTSGEAEDVRTTPKAGAPSGFRAQPNGSAESDNPLPGISTSTSENTEARSRLEQFRWTPACR